MDILHTFELYQLQLEDINANGYWSRPQVLRAFREQFRHFTAEDISTLTTFLTDNRKKWFVADLLNHLDTFPVDLLKPMIYAAVDEPDPGSNKEFIKPCRRVFGYLEIHHILLEIFREGDKARKIGVLKAFYWTNQTVYTLTVSEGNNRYELKGYDTFFWDIDFKSFEEEFKEDAEVYRKERPRQRAAYIEQLNAMLSEFFSTSDLELKYQIALYLPQKIEDFPEELSEQGHIFLRNKSKQGVPNNIAELDEVRNIKSYFLRNVLLRIKRAFTKGGNITLKQR
ncbi:hypothetical protein HHL16_18590 [Pseudoflavitalea sp. G-6-1-2]|uniref:hypothetical protein n=1 Tax=Pseudoflavitalea sp. G-6-1-2 TaxID=2728841 RepID=UPI00146D0A3F|nr:hypothetical protein [Pseudoflavitalea sp. G-6-1-2]NML22893.1 hypothetical protein [Pseudoflavitalea sp. G-6-1-2]